MIGVNAVTDKENDLSILSELLLGGAGEAEGARIDITFNSF